MCAELIQTELHHVRTLKIMTRLFRTGMLEELQLEPGVVQGLFPCVDELSDIHTRFLSQLLDRRRQALCPGSTRNFVIPRLGDLLISQFSGPSAEQMRKTYSEFCSRHTKALKLYKELYARDKRFQQFIRVSGPPWGPRPAPIHGAHVGSGSASRDPQCSRAQAFPRRVWPLPQARGSRPHFPDALL